jgi:hypothetical protein
MRPMEPMGAPAPGRRLRPGGAPPPGRSDTSAAVGSAMVGGELGERNARTGNSRGSGSWGGGATAAAAATAAAERGREELVV